MLRNHRAGKGQQAHKLVTKFGFVLGDGSGLSSSFPLTTTELIHYLVKHPYVHEVTRGGWLPRIKGGKAAVEILCWSLSYNPSSSLTAYPCTLESLGQGTLICVVIRTCQGAAFLRCTTIGCPGYQDIGAAFRLTDM